MDEERYLECLEADYTRLREVVAGAMDETVPSCPDWSGADLAVHVAEVFLHKAETMRLGTYPAPWPPDLRADPLGALDENYRRLVDEFAARDTADHSLTWYGPDQTVGFWLRRMAHETVIHRLDAEFAAGVPHDPVPSDLADDGIDELLVCFLAYSSTEYPAELEDLPECDGRTVQINTGSSGWQVQLGPMEITVERGQADPEAGVFGESDAMLRWVWRRAGDEVVQLDGNRWVLGKLRRMLGVVTQ